MGILEHMMEKHAPCLEKNCGHCCDPVKVGIKNVGQLPKDKNEGKYLFLEKNILFQRPNQTQQELKHLIVLTSTQ